MRIIRWLVRLLWAALIRLARFTGTKLDQATGAADHYGDARDPNQAVVQPQEDYKPWVFDHLDEQGVYVKRHDNQPILMTYGMMLAALNGLKRPKTIEEYFEPRHREAATEAFQGAADYLEVQAYLWT